MRINIPASEIQPGDTLNLETVTKVTDNGAIWVETEEDTHAPYRPDFRVNVNR